MLHVLEKGVAQCGAAVVMGCDVPHLDGKILASVYGMLVSGDNVVGPATDGGFYILGLHSVKKALFEEVDWGKAQVLQGLRRNAEKLSVEFVECTTLRDIDNWTDLVWLSGQDASYAHFLVPDQNPI